MCLEFALGEDEDEPLASKKFQTYTEFAAIKSGFCMYLLAIQMH